MSLTEIYRTALVKINKLPDDYESHCQALREASTLDRKNYLSAIKISGEALKAPALTDKFEAVSYFVDDILAHDIDDRQKLKLITLATDDVLGKTKDYSKQLELGF